MKTLKFKLYDEPMEVYFFTSRYELNNKLFIGARTVEDDDFYGDITVNLPFGYINNDNEFYADTNNSKEIIKAMLEQELIKETAESMSSGYCIYPKMKLTRKFKEYCK